MGAALRLGDRGTDVAVVTTREREHPGSGSGELVKTHIAAALMGFPRAQFPLAGVPQPA